MLTFAADKPWRQLPYPPGNLVEPDLFVTEVEPDLFVTEVEPDLFVTEVEPDLFVTEVEPDLFVTEASLSCSRVQRKLMTTVTRLSFSHQFTAR